MVFKKKFITKNREVVELQIVYRSEQSHGSFNIMLIRNHLVLLNITVLDTKNDYVSDPDSDGNPKQIPAEAVKLFESFRSLCNL